MRRVAVAVAALAVLALATTAARAYFTWHEQNPQSIRAVDNFTPLDLKDAVIVKAAGGDGGALKPNADYQVYADVAGATGATTVKADVSQITAGQTAAPLTAGTYTADGKQWNWRSGVLHAGNFADGTSKDFVVTAKDGTVTKTLTRSVKFDSTVPKNTDIQIVNGSGVRGKIDSGDTIQLFYTEPIDRPSIDGDWTGTDETARIRVGADLTNNKITFLSADGSQTLPLGEIETKADFVNGISVFEVRATRSGSRIDYVVGNKVSGPAPLTETNARQLNWNASGQITDPAGNTINGFNVFETGPSDIDF